MKKELLHQIITDQNATRMPSNLVLRTKYKQLVTLQKSSQIIIILGLRRAGKSTLLQTLRLNAKNQTGRQSDYYVNFDDDRFATFKLEDFDQLNETLIQLYGEQDTYYFDEIQNITGWERFIRRLHNMGKKIYITGSNAQLLSIELGTHLTGRNIPLTVYPFSFYEYLLSKNSKLIDYAKLDSTQLAILKKHYYEYVKNGGIPEYLENNSLEYLQAIFENILYKDIIVRNKISNPKPLQELVYYLASNNTKEFTYNSLKNLVGIKSANTIADYCSYLENSFLCFSVSRFSYSLKKQVHSSKKIYFIDQALARSVGFINSPDSGRILENIVFLQLKRLGLNIYFHKEKYECDFIIRQGYTVAAAIQVCKDLSCPKTLEREINGLIDALQSYQLDSGIIITEDTTESRTITKANKQYNINLIPCWQWLLDTENSDFSLTNSN